MSDLIQELIGKNLRYYLEKHESHKFDGNKTLCPFHNDTSPSMTVDEKAGVWLWYCHGKCKMGGDIITYYMKKHGVTKGVAIKELAKVFGLEIVKQAIKKPVIVATYPYLDEQGKQLYKIIRYNPKTFRADRKLNDIRQVLYRLPEVMKANSLWLVEGEKDVDNVHKLGLTVTTAPFGMSNWKPEFAQSLKGKEVRICLDVGAEREARKRAASILKAGAKEVKIIELPGLDKEGSDISDWINSHDSQTNEDLKLQLEEIAEETPCFELPGGKLKINNNFLDLYIDSISRITDAPEIFILFSGLGLLSGICNKFYFKYPRITPLNLYILLLA
ncbi:MAG TPA: CHC2 zinc finger domain-containing protein, partial [Nitrospinota bacterium]|nr:CHC2 zinc finger domain-containing protein [Nitrospinota bacterium]